MVDFLIAGHIYQLQTLKEGTNVNAVEPQSCGLHSYGKLGQGHRN